MGLRTLADKGCGLTDAIGEYMKMKLMRDELEQNKGLREAQTMYYLAQANYLDRDRGKVGRGGGKGTTTTEVPTSLFTPSGDINPAALKASPAATKNLVMQSTGGVQGDAGYLNASSKKISDIFKESGLPSPGGLNLPTAQGAITKAVAEKNNRGAQAAILNQTLRALFSGGVDATDIPGIVGTAQGAANPTTPAQPLVTGPTTTLPPKLPGETLEAYKTRTGL